MQTFKLNIFRSFLAILRSAFVAFFAFALFFAPAHAQNNDALNAIMSLSNDFDSSMGGVSQDVLLQSLEEAAAQGEPIAMWRLGVMYENGDGVAKDEVKAFAYFSRIANDYASTPPKSLQADIVAQSFIKIGDYYRDGLPDAGVRASNKRFHALLLHAASYFGDPDAQFRVGRLYLDENEMGINPTQSARWLSKAARKGHVGAQATLGDLLFNDSENEAQRLEGLMWLSLAGNLASGTSQELWVTALRDQAMSIATPEQRLSATKAAQDLGVRFGGS
jgi:hypothetical protein